MLSILVILAIAGSYYVGFRYPQSQQQVTAGSPVGTVFNTAKTSAIAFSMANSTSTSILNTDAFMRLVKASDIACTGVGSSKTAFVGTGLATLTMLIGTSSTATPTPFSPAAEVGNITISTSTTDFLNASSTTQTATSTYPIEWPTGTYMTFVTNATNTAVCTVGTDYLGS